MKRLIARRPIARRLIGTLLTAVTLVLVVAVATPADAASCSLASLAKDPRLASFSGYVSTSGGRALYSSAGATPASTGSVLKLLTASAALNVLGADYRLKTTVVAGTKPGTVVLVGGGDPTLSRVSSSFYSGAPTLASLAAQVKKAYPGKITTVVVDASYWSTSDNWDSTWKRSEQRIGYLSETSALQVDGDRNNPRASVSPRSTHPATRAGRWFAEALGVPHATVVAGTAPASARRLGVVKSRPVSALIRQMLLASDGTLAESIARVTSKVSGADGSAKSLATVIPTLVGSYGLDTSRVTIRDGSGLSTRNAVSPKFVTQLLRKLPSAARAGLSVAGRTGSLAGRFTSSPARGHILAKTGWLDTEYSLAGLVHAADGSTEYFAFYAIGGHVQPSAKVALDALASRVYGCGAATR